MSTIKSLYLIAIEYFAGLPAAIPVARDPQAGSLQISDEHFNLCFPKLLDVFGICAGIGDDHIDVGYRAHVSETLRAELGVVHQGNASFGCLEDHLFDLRLCLP